MSFTKAYVQDALGMSCSLGVKVVPALDDKFHFKKFVTKQFVSQKDNSTKPTMATGIGTEGSSNEKTNGSSSDNKIKVRESSHLSLPLNFYH